MTTEINGRKIYFENDAARVCGVMATCNSCDRVIYEDELQGYPEGESYTTSAGYCPECLADSKTQE